MGDKHMVLVTGTWGEKSEEEWHKDKKWKDDLADIGIKQLDRDVPFLWSSNLDGLIGENYDWRSGGAALKNYIEARQCKYGITNEPINLISHSHGMQIVAYAAYFGLRLGTVVTVAGPKRDKLDRQYKSIQTGSKCWIHVHSDWRDVWQLFGSLRWGSPFGQARDMKYANKNVYIPHTSHTDLMDFELLRNQGIFRSIMKGAPVQ